MDSFGSRSSKDQKAASRPRSGVACQRLTARKFLVTSWRGDESRYFLRGRPPRKRENRIRRRAGRGSCRPPYRCTLKSPRTQMHLKKPEKPRSLRRASPSRAQPNDELPAVWRAVRRRARYAAGGGDGGFGGLGGGFGGLGGGMSNSFPVRAAPAAACR